MSDDPMGKGPIKTEGIGHPNIIIEKDYAGNGKWYARLETMVPIKDADVKKVQDWLKVPKGGFDAAKYLVDHVPDDAKQDSAKHMVAAAFGFEFDRKSGAVVRTP